MSTLRVRLIGEFLVIVVGVLSALAVDDYRALRTDRRLEEHLLEGLRSDLTRDTVDAEAVIRAALGRAAAADELLSLLDDPSSGRIEDMGWGLDDYLREAREHFPPGSMDVRVAFLMLADLRRLDLSDATFSEAVASGGLGVVQNLDLRSAVATHYANALRYERADERGETAMLRFRQVLADAGVSLSDGPTDLAGLTRLRSVPSFVAELQNSREFALRQVAQNALFLASATDVLNTLKS